MATESCTKSFIEELIS